MPTTSQRNDRVANHFTYPNDAAAANVACYPHVFGSGVALAASLQVLAAIPGTPFLEFDRTPNPLREELVTPAITNDGAAVRVPDGDGLGVTVNTEALDRFRVEPDAG